jgi:hypothetical protein
LIRQQRLVIKEVSHIHLIRNAFDELKTIGIKNPKKKREKNYKITDLSIKTILNVWCFSPRFASSNSPQTIHCDISINANVISVGRVKQKKKKRKVLKLENSWKIFYLINT